VPDVTYNVPSGKVAYSGHVDNAGAAAVNAQRGVVATKINLIRILTDIWTSLTTRVSDLFDISSGLDARVTNLESASGVPGKLIGVAWHDVDPSMTEVTIPEFAATNAIVVVMRCYIFLNNSGISVARNVPLMLNGVDLSTQISPDWKFHIRRGVVANNGESGDHEMTMIINPATVTGIDFTVPNIVRVGNPWDETTGGALSGNYMVTVFAY